MSLVGLEAAGRACFRWSSSRLLRGRDMKQIREGGGERAGRVGEGEWAERVISYRAAASEQRMIGEWPGNGPDAVPSLPTDRDATRTEAVSPDRTHAVQPNWNKQRVAPWLRSTRRWLLLLVPLRLPKTFSSPFFSPHHVEQILVPVHVRCRDRRCLHWMGIFRQSRAGRTSNLRLRRWRIQCLPRTSHRHHTRHPTGSNREVSSIYR